MRLSKEVEVLPGSPNTLIYQGRAVVDLGGKNSSVDVNAELQLATHGHMDHIAGLLKNSKRKFIPKEDLWALSLMGRRVMTYGFSSKDSSLFTFDLIKDSISIEPGDSEVEVVKLPGHTPGHSGYILGDTLYAGDAFFGKKVLEGFVFPFYLDFWQAMESLEKLRDIAKGVNNLVISHGPIQEAKKMRELLEYNLEYGAKLVKWVKEEISTPSTAEQVVVRVMRRLGAKISPANVFLNEIVVKSILAQVGRAEVGDDGVIFVSN
ncbi:MBL fold metallo-hydrolase [Metallosphaera tengchongensis]|uniref:MBL fold metallo-hydrolase n=1 Tax=Metallosphaera tengchongensis TaxID=1532350 RepID=A0A6N0NZ02_9CREN|nr:MBL fold metallo-hydrolase [Metallosphaera tengchongensis]QKR00598.1 MBL fold metallo-hydrolase [Metallosphaera tengchongensis]